MDATSHEPFKSFTDYYPFHLSEHRSANCRRLHFLGSLGALFCLAKMLATSNLWWLVVALAWGYGLAWAGHHLFEKDHPASLRQPFYSFCGDWVMFRDILIGRIPF